MKNRLAKLALAVLIAVYLALILAGTALLVRELSGSWIAGTAATAALALRLTLIPSLLAAWYVFSYTEFPAAAFIFGCAGIGEGMGPGPRGLPDIAVRLFREALRPER